MRRKIRTPNTLVQRVRVAQCFCGFFRETLLALFEPDTSLMESSGNKNGKAEAGDGKRGELGREVKRHIKKRMKGGRERERERERKRCLWPS